MEKLCVILLLGHSGLCRLWAAFVPSRHDQRRGQADMKSVLSILNVSNKDVFASSLNNLAANQDTSIQTI